MDSIEIKSSKTNKPSTPGTSTQCQEQVQPRNLAEQGEPLQKKYFTASQHRRYQRKKVKKRGETGSENENKQKVSTTTPDIIKKSDCTSNFNNQSYEKNADVPKLSSKDITITHSEVGNVEHCNTEKSHNLQTDSDNNKALLIDKMDSKKSEKSREEIMAEREAKKLAKQLAKAKITSGDISVKPVLKTLNEDVNKNILIKKVSESTTVTVNNTDSKNIEKSREKVIAEREAKKLAKQLAKTKNKGNTDVAPLESAHSPVSSTEVTIQIDKLSINESVKNIPDSEKSDSQEKSKAELKAERRAKQEAQRKAKELLQAAKTNSSSIDTKKQDIKVPDKTKLAPSSANIKISQSPEKMKLKLIQSQHKVKLFNHLYGEREAACSVPSIPLNSKEIHPAIVRLGVQYASHIIMGSNARCIALLNALKQVIEDYTLPPNVEFSRGLEAHLTPSINFLKSCRPPAVSMNNALRHIKWQLTQLPNTIAEYDAKTKLTEAIDTYVREQIEVAGQAISIAVCNKISNGDVILTYGCSSLIENIITEAAASKCFRVVVVAAHPWNEGREMLRRLTVKGVKCSLIMISALSFVMREINKVILGAGALLANGYVMARAGTAQVAMVAHAHNVPVLVCCETHKFSERVQTDSFVYNEIGNPDDLIKCDPSHQDSPLSNWRAYNSLTLLNLTYDVTPPDLVTAVVTELAILPCTSVPVILRIKPSEFGV